MPGKQAASSPRNESEIPLQSNFPASGGGGRKGGHLFYIGRSRWFNVLSCKWRLISSSTTDVKRIRLRTSLGVSNRFNFGSGRTWICSAYRLFFGFKSKIFPGNERSAVFGRELVRANLALGNNKWSWIGKLKPIGSDQNGFCKIWIYSTTWRGGKKC